jgi:hypothetical protein
MSQAARFLVLAVPGGLEELYRAAGHDLSKPVPDGWAVSVARIAESEAERTNRVLGPPPGIDDPQAQIPSL